ncbi:MAG: hypothetical protein ABIH78_00560 [Candidatus Peregrinibacteria bacterium]
MTKIAKHVALCLAIPLMLTGCFSTNTTSPAGTTSAYETANFTINVPTDWEILEKADFTSNVPASTIVAFRNNIKSDIFNANLNILVENTSIKDLPDFVKSATEITKNTLISYQEIDTQNIEVPYGSTILPGIIVRFQGKQTAPDSIIEFRQLFVINNGSVYTLTGAYLPDEDESVVNYINEMINSFSLK